MTNAYVLHKHCWSCGAAQIPPECPHCLSTVDTSHTFCTECGKPLRQEFVEPRKVKVEEAGRPKLQAWRVQLHTKHREWVDRLTEDDEYAFSNWLSDRLTKELPAFEERKGRAGLGREYNLYILRVTAATYNRAIDLGGVLLLRELIEEEVER